MWSIECFLSQFLRRVLTKRCDPGVEFSGNKLQTIHIFGLWKASALGMKEDEMVQKFKAEMTLVQEAHKEHGRKRSLTQLKADWHQAAKRVCRRLEEPYENPAGASFGGA